VCCRACLSLFGQNFQTFVLFLGAYHAVSTVPDLLSHSTSFSAQQYFFRSVLRMGERDYLYDNQAEKPFSGQENYIFFLLCFFERKNL
jgi:hypothetical protein